MAVPDSRYTLAITSYENHNNNAVRAAHWSQCQRPKSRIIKARYLGVAKKTWGKGSTAVSTLDAAAAVDPKCRQMGGARGGGAEWRGAVVADEAGAVVVVL